MEIFDLFRNIIYLSAVYVFLSFTYRLLRNILICRQIGFPVIVYPLHRMNPISLFSAPFNRWFIERLPFGLSEWKYLHFYYRDWEYNTKFEQFAEFGDVFMEATSGGRTCYIANAEAAYQVFHRRDEFPKDIEYYKVVRFFGDSVLTTGGAKWRHQRKITSPSFSEDVYSLVWAETLSQSVSIITQWQSAPNPLVSGPDNIPGHLIAPDTKSLALNLISKAGFGVSLPMVSASSRRTKTSNTPSNRKGEIDITDDEYFSVDFTPPGHSFSFGEALDTVLSHAIFVAITPLSLLHRGTAFMKKLALAYEDVELYLTELLARERLSPSATLLGALAHGGGLTEEETIGNIFIFALAGLETTAGTLQYAVLLLALHPEIQEWLYQDTKEALDGESADPTEWDYNKVYPKLVGCLCVIHETLRLHPTFQQLPKTTGPSAQILTVSGRTYLLPAETSVFATLTGLHYNPAYWGASPAEFTPRKWDARDPNSGWYAADGTSISTEIQPGTQLRQPLKGSWVAFAEGFRSCLGKKFALMEMCAFLAVLFGRYRVTIESGVGETQSQANDRARRIMRESTALVTVAMRGEVGVRIVER
ncbi:cytochrome P450 [Wilcoxina mikolae CBS 423.85]|nr:cytochrome P450 [Wilcoxina mikolae CBS 423.85]